MIRMQPTQSDINRPDLYAQNANYFYTTFDDTLNRMENLELAQQGEAYQNLSTITGLFKSLKEKVQTAYLDPNSGAVLESVVLQLVEADALLNKIEKYHSITLELLKLSDQVGRLFLTFSASEFPSSAVRAFKERFTKVENSEDLNWGHRQEIQRLHGNRDVQQLIQKTSSTISSIQESIVQSDRQIQEETDENFTVGTFVDQWNALLEDMTNDPCENFEMLLSFYEKAQKNKCLIPANQKKMEEILKDADQYMQFAITTQGNLEGKQIVPNQTQQGGSNALLGLKSAVESAYKETQKDNANFEAIRTSVQLAFNNLSKEEKGRLFQSVNKKHILDGKTALPDSFLNLAFAHWGAYQIKLAALSDILSSSKPLNAPVIVIKPKSEEMHERMLAAVEAARKQPQIINNSSHTTTTSSNSNSPINPPTTRSFSRNNSSPPQSSLVYGGFTSPNNPITQQSQPQPFTVSTTSYNTKTNSTRGDRMTTAQPSPSIESMASILELEDLLFLLQDEGTCGNLEEACQELFKMESKGSKLPSKISSKIPSIIAERPYYHLCLINQGECSIKVEMDIEYGRNAMNGSFLTTNLERRRAIQRTIVELALEGLRDAKIEEDVNSILRAFDRLKMNIRDLPRRWTNIGDVLTNEMYWLQKEAFGENSGLENPDDPKFENNFGREAFYIFDASKVLPKTKVYAIRNIREELKKAWNVS